MNYTFTIDAGLIIAIVGIGMYIIAIAILLGIHLGKREAERNFCKDYLDE